MKLVEVSPQEPFIRQLVGGKWITGEPCAYTFEGVTVIVPEGFKTDLASIPRAIWPIMAPHELSVAAPLLHDYLYRCGGVPPTAQVWPPTRTFTRSEIDGLLLAVMKAEGVSAWRAYSAYVAVRVFGSFCWANPRLAC